MWRILVRITNCLLNSSLFVQTFTSRCVLFKAFCCVCLSCFVWLWSSETQTICDWKPLLWNLMSWPNHIPCECRWLQLVNQNKIKVELFPLSQNAHRHFRIGFPSNVSLQSQLPKGISQERSIFSALKSLICLKVFVYCTCPERYYHLFPHFSVNQLPKGAKLTLQTKCGLKVSSSLKQ